MIWKCESCTSNGFTKTMINEYVDDESDNESDDKVEDLVDSTNHTDDTLASSFQQFSQVISTKIFPADIKITSEKTQNMFPWSAVWPCWYTCWGIFSISPWAMPYAKWYFSASVYKWATAGPPAKHHSCGFSLVADYWVACVCMLGG